MAEIIEELNDQMKVRHEKMETLRESGMIHSDINLLVHTTLQNYMRNTMKILKKNYTKKTCMQQSRDV